MSKTTLITGASSGIGMHLAHEFAKNGHPVVIVAPIAAELQAIASEFKAHHGVDATVIAKDLEDPQAAQEIFDELAAKGIQIDILVNNAGYGQGGDFIEGDLDRYVGMVRLNVEALMRLSRLFLPPMRERGAGKLLNVASIAGFTPGPGNAVYHATKSFVLSFTEALATELEKTGITVTALCPGMTDTDFFEKADMEDTKQVQEGKMMSPQEVAKIGYDALMAGERVVIAGLSNKLQAMAGKFLPEWVTSKSIYSKSQEVPPEKQEIKRGQAEGASALVD